MALTIYPYGVSGNVLVPNPVRLKNADARSSSGAKGGVIQTVW